MFEDASAEREQFVERVRLEAERIADGLTEDLPDGLTAKYDDTDVLAPIDPTCAFHGIKWSEHEGGRCLHCPLCFRSDLGYPKHVDADGQMWDVCVECVEMEAHMGREEEGS